MFDQRCAQGSSPHGRQAPGASWRSQLTVLRTDDLGFASIDNVYWKRHPRPLRGTIEFDAGHSSWSSVETETRVATPAPSAGGRSLVVGAETADPRVSRAWRAGRHGEHDGRRRRRAPPSSYVWTPTADRPGQGLRGTLHAVADADDQDRGPAATALSTKPEPSASAPAAARVIGAMASGPVAAR